MENVFFNNRLRLSVTNKCNFSCFYCSNEGQNHGESDFVDTKFLKKLFLRLKEEDVYIKKINLTGGEPLLHKEIIEIVNLASLISNEVTLNTNGSLLNFHLIDDFRKAGLNCIKFGSDNIFVRNSKPILIEENQNIGKLKELILYSMSILPRSSMNLVMTNFNINYFEDLLNWVIDNRVDKVEFIELIKFDFIKNKTVLKDSVNYQNLLKKYSKNFIKIQYNKNLAKYIAYHKSGITVQFAEDFCKRRVCGNLWTRLNCHGRLTPCIIYNDTYNIDLKKNITKQILLMKPLVCNLPNNFLPRNEIGELSREDTFTRNNHVVPNNNFINEYTDIDL